MSIRNKSLVRLESQMSSLGARINSNQTELRVSSMISSMNGLKIEQLTNSVSNLDNELAASVVSSANTTLILQKILESGIPMTPSGTVDQVSAGDQSVSGTHPDDGVSVTVSMFGVPSSTTVVGGVWQINYDVVVGTMHVTFDATQALSSTLIIEVTPAENVVMQCTMGDGIPLGDVDPVLPFTGSVPGVITPFGTNIVTNGVNVHATDRGIALNGSNYHDFVFDAVPSDGIVVTWVFRKDSGPSGNSFFYIEVSPILVEVQSRSSNRWRVGYDGTWSSNQDSNPLYDVLWFVIFPSSLEVYSGLSKSLILTTTGSFFNGCLRCLEVGNTINGVSDYLKITQIQAPFNVSMLNTTII